MSFREKTAWVTLCAIVFVSLLFWMHVHSLFESHHSGWVLMALGASLGTYLLIEAIAWLVLRLRNPQDSREPKDEREKLIDLKALRIAYVVFVMASFLSIFFAVHHVRGNAQSLGTLVLIAFVLSQAAKHIARIVYYRRS